MPSFAMSAIRKTLMPPAVDPAQPPMYETIASMSGTWSGHSAKFAVV
jgi:hypothetical protein